MERNILRDIIHNIDFYDEKLNILLPKNKINLSSLCIICNDEEYDNAKNPEKKSICIGVFIIKDIIENLRSQKLNFDEKDVLDAIKFYLQNDSFINLILSG